MKTKNEKAVGVKGRVGALTDKPGDGQAGCGKCQYTDNAAAR